jgi:predicted nucleotidyltransferase
MNVKFCNRNVVIKALVGSHNYNLNTPESDEDFKYFVAPTFDDLYAGKFYSHGNTSDDLDYTVHDIRKLSHLLWKANPNFLGVLFSQKFYGEGSFPEWLIFNRDDLSKMHLRSFGFACLGMHKQKMASLYKGTEKTQKFVDQFGYDTKDAHHALRMLYLAQNIAEGMSMEEAFWFENGTPAREVLMTIKRNEVPLTVFLMLVEQWHKYKFDFVESFYKAQEPNNFVKNELDHRTKEFVKESLF